jgi:Uma2 family endonuclease
MATERITWRDALLMPEDTRRYEAIEGELYVIPAPSRDHQWVSHWLAVALHRLLVEPGFGEVYEASFGVEFPDTEEGVQPDLLFVSRERVEIVGEDWVRGAPDLVVEILSPTTAEKDRGVKKKLYRRQRVAEYWIVDPATKAVELWDFAAGGRRPKRHTERVPVHVGRKVIGYVELAKVFRRG